MISDQMLVEVLSDADLAEVSGGNFWVDFAKWVIYDSAWQGIKSGAGAAYDWYNSLDPTTQLNVATAMAGYYPRP